MSYKVLITKEVKSFLDRLDKKSKRICLNNLKKLIEDPYPGSGLGDKEKLQVGGEEIYRLHIGRTWTAFYDILEIKKQVRIVEILPIDEAHEKYSY